MKKCRKLSTAPAAPRGRFTLKRGLVTFFSVLVIISTFIPVTTALASPAYLSRSEALQYLNFDTAIDRWVELYQCSRSEATNKVINSLDDRLIIRLGTLAKDKGHIANITLAFRPSSYQEMLAARNGGHWDSSKCSESNTLVQNLKAWYGVDTSVCASPGTSNHNTGAAADVPDQWVEDLSESTVETYGLTKNVSGEPWHVVVIEMASISGYDRVQYAIDHGLEPIICPCRDTYVSNQYIKYGASVAEVQKKLKARGFSPGAIDGAFGSGTKQAVINFQTANGLTADGICGADTISALWNPPPVTNIQITSATLSASSIRKSGTLTCTVTTNVRASGVTAQLNGNAAKAMSGNSAGTTWTCTYSGFTSTGTRTIIFTATGTNGSTATTSRSFQVTT